jgi:hypothetical protein
MRRHGKVRKLGNPAGGDDVGRLVDAVVPIAANGIAGIDLVIGNIGCFQGLGHTQTDKASPDNQMLGAGVQWDEGTRAGIGAYHG